MNYLYTGPHQVKSQVFKADRIVVLVDGAIAEEGTHNELLAREAEYNKLYTLQLLEGGEGQTRKAVALIEGI